LHEVEPLVSVEVWDECNKLIDESYSVQKRTAKKPVHVFAGVVHCECGQKMYVPPTDPNTSAGVPEQNQHRRPRRNLFCE